MNITNILNDCHHFLQEEIHQNSQQPMAETQKAFETLHHFVNEFSDIDGQIDPLKKDDLARFNHILDQFDEIKNAKANNDTLSNLLNVVEDARDTYYEVHWEGENVWTSYDDNDNEEPSTFNTLNEAVEELEEYFIDSFQAWKAQDLSSGPDLEDYEIVKITKNGQTTVDFAFRDTEAVFAAKHMNDDELLSALLEKQNKEKALDALEKKEQEEKHRLEIGDFLLDEKGSKLGFIQKIDGNQITYLNHLSDNDTTTINVENSTVYPGDSGSTATEGFFDKIKHSTASAKKLLDNEVVNKKLWGESQNKDLYGGNKIYTYHEDSSSLLYNLNQDLKKNHNAGIKVYISEEKQNKFALFAENSWIENGIENSFVNENPLFFENIDDAMKAGGVLVKMMADRHALRQKLDINSIIEKNYKTRNKFEI